MPHSPRRRRFAGKPGQPTSRHVIEDRCGVTGKVRYRTSVGAMEALTALLEMQDPRHHECRAYGPCVFCAGYHLTSQWYAA
jgi:hypothetical protein